jgi:serine protease inhibitor
MPTYLQTKGHTLEQIAAIFGDEVIDMSAVEDVTEKQANNDHDFKSVSAVEQKEQTGENIISSA